MQVLDTKRGLLPGNYDPVNIAISYYFVMLCIYTSFASIIPGIAMTMIQMMFYMLTANAIFCIGRSLNYKHITFCFLAAIALISSLFVAKDTDVFSRVGLTLVRWCFPLFFLGAAVRDIDDLKQCMRKASAVIIALTYISTFVTKSSGNVVEAYSQDVGYQTVIPFVVFFLDYLLQRRKKDLLGVVLAFFAILMSGARGPLLCAAIGFFMAWICLGKFDTKSVIATFFALIFLSTIVIVFYQDILFALIQLFNKFGISTRVLTGLAGSNIADDSSRSMLRNFALDYAKNHILFGTGIINDRKLIYDNLTINSNKTVYGYYCHNFFLENLMQFGLAPGIVICAIWVKNIVSPLRRCNPENLRIIAIIMCAAGFLPLLVSYSYITYQYFFLLAGFAFSYKNILVLHDFEEQIYEE